MAPSLTSLLTLSQAFKDWTAPSAAASSSNTEITTCFSLMNVLLRRRSARCHQREGPIEEPPPPRAVQHGRNADTGHWVQRLAALIARPRRAPRRRGSRDRDLPGVRGVPRLRLREAVPGVAGFKRPAAGRRIRFLVATIQVGGHFQTGGAARRTLPLRRRGWCQAASARRRGRSCRSGRRAGGSSPDPQPRRTAGAIMSSMPGLITWVTAAGVGGLARPLSGPGTGCRTRQPHCACCTSGTATAWTPG